METRRTFLQKTSALMFTTLASPTLLMASQGRIKNVGIQLWSLRDVIHQDTQKVLNRLAQFGYKEIESYGLEADKLHKFAPLEFKKMVTGLGMKLISSHTSFVRETDKPVKESLDVFAPKWKGIVETANQLGLKYLTIGWMPEHFRNSGDENKRSAEAVIKMSEYAAQQGVTLTYHNHDFEFKDYEGENLYDILLTQSNPKHLNFEMDLYWVVYAGKDPLPYFENHPHRFFQWHVKDMSKSKREDNADLGQGAIDFVPIFQAIKKAGAKHFFVEQESGYNPDSITSAGNCLTFMKKLQF
jgi:sugar phosphate isomerase/epimerase